MRRHHEGEGAAPVRAAAEAGAQTAQRHFEDIVVGEPLPILVKRPTTTMLFRFSAVTWNGHRIHYDEPYALSEGHPGVLVQATMHGGFLAQMLAGFAGPAGRVVRMAYENRGRAVAGDVLTCEGTVVRKDPQTQCVYCSIAERNQAGQECARGDAIVFLPSRSQAPGTAERQRPGGHEF